MLATAAQPTTHRLICPRCRAWLAALPAPASIIRTLKRLQHVTRGNAGVYCKRCKHVVEFKLHG